MTLLKHVPDKYSVYQMKQKFILEGYLMDFKLLVKDKSLQSRPTLTLHNVHSHLGNVKLSLRMEMGSSYNFILHKYFPRKTAQDHCTSWDDPFPVSLLGTEHHYTASWQLTSEQLRKLSSDAGVLTTIFSFSF